MEFEPVAAEVVAELTARLDLVSCRYEPWPFDCVLPRIEPGEVVLPADEPGAASYHSWKPPAGIELPVRARGVPLGRFVLVPRQPTCGVAFSPADRRRALELAHRCSAVLLSDLTEGVRA